MKEIKNPFVLKAYVLSGKLEDRIAEEVMQKMKKGDLITKTSDTRKYVETKDTRTPSQKFSDKIKSDYHKMKQERNERVFGKSKSGKSPSGSGAGRWVTINGAHVYLG